MNTKHTNLPTAEIQFSNNHNGPARRGLFTAATAAAFMFAVNGCSVSPESKFSSDGEKNAQLVAAAESGDANAQYQLGAKFADTFYEQTTRIRSAYWLRKAAEQNHAAAQLKFSELLFGGDGIEQNQKEAMQWLIKAAEQGNAGAQYRYAEKLYNGTELEKNVTEAIKWYRKAAAQGNKWAKEAVDSPEIVTLLAEADDADAQYKMGLLIGTYNEDKTAKSTNWFRKAAEQNHAGAQYKYADALLNGTGTIKNILEAEKWYRKSAVQGNDDAKNALTANEDLFSITHLIPKAKAGDVEAQYKLGLAYLEKKNGIENDISKAEAWLEKAAEQGSAEAQKALDKNEALFSDVESLIQPKRYVKTENGVQDRFLDFEFTSISDIGSYYPANNMKDKLKGRFPTISEVTHLYKNRLLYSDLLEIKTGLCPGNGRLIDIASGRTFPDTKSTWDRFRVNAIVIFNTNKEFSNDTEILYKIREFQNNYANKVYDGLLAKTKEFNTAKEYRRYIRRFNGKATEQIKLAKVALAAVLLPDVNEKNTIEDYDALLRECDVSSPEVTKAFEKLFVLVAQENTIERYEWFYKKYSGTSKGKSALEGIFALVAKENTIERYDWYCKEYPNSSRNGDSVEKMFSLVAKENTIERYDWYCKEYPNSSRNGDSVEKMFSLVAKENTIERYVWFYKNYSSTSKAISTLEALFTVVAKENTIEHYEWYYNEYPESPKKISALENIFALVAKENTYEKYDWYYKKYPESPKKNAALEGIFDLAVKDSIIGRYDWYYKTYSESPKRQVALEKLYYLVKTKNSVPCYAWFINDYSDSPLATDALMRMYAEAFRLAKAVNTVEAYNDFIIAYPLAKEVKAAGDLAYALEKTRYAGGNKDEKSRILLNKSKRIWLTGNENDVSLRQGYAVVVGRMTQLLETEFPAEKATSEILDNEESRKFRKELKESLTGIQTSLNRIEDALSQQNRQLSEIADLIRAQTRLANRHFESAAQDRVYAQRHAEDSMNWVKQKRQEDEWRRNR